MADDIIEAYRPMADYLVKELLKDEKESEAFLTKAQRAALIGVTVQNCKIGGEIQVLHNAIEKTCASFVGALRQKTPAVLELPTFNL